MDFFRNKKHCICLSIAAAMAATGITAAIPQMEKKDVPLMAWWGTLYPRFCFSEMSQEEAKENEESESGLPDEVQIRTSFWVADFIESIMHGNKS